MIEGRDEIVEPEEKLGPGYMKAEGKGRARLR